MNILIISPNRLAFPSYVLPIGPAHLISYLRERGHACAFLDLCFIEESQIEKAIDDAISGSTPDIIGVSIRNYCTFMDDPPQFFLPLIKFIVDRCKSSTNAPIVLGGGGFSNDAEQILQFLGVELGIRGEGEDAFGALIDAVDGKIALERVPNLVFLNKEGKYVRNQTRFLGSVSTLPFPARDVYDPRYYSTLSELDLITTETVLTSRGCPFQCIYCFNPNFYREKFATRNVANVCEEIESLVAKGVEKIQFLDFSFNLPIGHAAGILREIEKRKIKFTWSASIHPYPENSLPEELFGLMQETGCTHLELDTITGSRAMAKTLKRPHFSKHSILHTARLCHKYNISFSHYLLMGGPGENTATVSETLALIAETEPNGRPGVVTNVGVIIGSHTKLAEIAMREKIISEHTNLLFPPQIYLSSDFDSEAIAVIKQYQQQHPDWLFVGLKFERLLQSFGSIPFVDGVILPEETCRLHRALPQIVLHDLDKQLVNISKNNGKRKIYLFDSRASADDALPWIMWAKSKFGNRDDMEIFFISVIQDLRFFISKDFILGHVKKGSHGINRLLDWEHRFYNSLQLSDLSRPALAATDNDNSLIAACYLEEFSDESTAEVGARIVGDHITEAGIRARAAS